MSGEGRWKSTDCLLCKETFEYIYGVRLSRSARVSLRGLCQAPSDSEERGIKNGLCVRVKSEDFRMNSKVTSASLVFGHKQVSV